MSNSEKFPTTGWMDAALAVCDLPHTTIDCLLCGTSALEGQWHLLSVKSREAVVDLRCSRCDAHESVRIELPEGAAPCWPLERFPMVAQAIEEEIGSFAARVRQHAKAMPAAAFASNPLWAEAKWSAITYQWHPTSEAPPVLGLVFENVQAGMDIFREAERQMNHEDRFEEIRVAIIERPVAGQEHHSGYSVHICADPDALAAHATFEDFVVDASIVPFLGQWNRHYPKPGEPSLLDRFKTEFEKHQEFLLAPTICRDDGKLYVEPLLGIIKNVIFFRQLSDITSPDDIDAAALWLPNFITPPSD